MAVFIQASLVAAEGIAGGFVGMLIVCIPYYFYLTHQNRKRRNASPRR